MSMPANRIYCTGCDFEQYVWHEPILLLCKIGSDVATYYPRISWCYECDHIVRAEGIPSKREIQAEIAAIASKEALLVVKPWIEDDRKTAEKIRERICRNKEKCPTLRCFNCNSLNVSIHGEWIVCEDCRYHLASSDIPCVLAINELQLKSDKKALQMLEAHAEIKRRIAIRELRARLQWRKARIAPPRCLNCGSANIAYLSFVRENAIEVSMTRTMAKDFMHPCGGSLVWASDQDNGVFIGFRDRVLWMDIEGNERGVHAVKMHESRLIYKCLRNDRVCPKPDAWQKIWKLMIKRIRKKVRLGPPQPFYQIDWHETTDLQKQERLLEHIHYAFLNGGYDDVADALSELSVKDWHHRGE